MKMAPGQLSVRLSIILAAIFSAFLLIGGPADAGGPPPPMTEYVVSAGDTLWSIAAGHTTPGHDVRVVIADIRDTSGLSDSGIHPGQILLIPTG